MASFKDIPFGQVKNVVDGFKTSQSSRHDCVRIAVVLDGKVSSSFAQSLKQALMPATPTGLVNVCALAPGAPLQVNPDCDFAIILAGSGNQAIGCAKAFAELNIPSSIIVESSVEVSSDNIPDGATLICASTPAVLLTKLAAWMVSVSSADVALATNFSFVRSAVIDKSISAHAAQNAVVGVLPFGNGADMPVMAANQFLMSMDLAGAYAHVSTADHIAAGSAIVTGSFASRALARKLAKQLPGLGWLVRGSVGFGATYAIGKALEVAHAVQDAWKTRQ